MCYNPVAVTVSINNYGNRMNKFIKDRFIDIPLGTAFIQDINKNYKTIFVACGKCYACRLSRVNTWVTRATFEMQKYNNRACMLTLTYNNDYMDDPSLNYSDFQGFMKRLRYHLNNRKIIFLAVGEYGFKSDRKHFHALLINVTKDDLKAIQKSWHFGYSYVKNADVNALRYILKYSFKQQFKSKDYYIKKGLKEPMFQCSKGISKDFALDEKNIDKYLNQNFISINGKPQPIPRYYFKLLKDRGYLHDTYNFDNLDYKNLLKKFLIRFINEDKVDELMFRLSPFKNKENLFSVLSIVHSDYSELNDRKYRKFLDDFKEVV